MRTPIPDFCAKEVRTADVPGIVVLDIGNDIVVVDATDLRAKEPVGDGWRVHDRDDSAIDDAGPLWVFLTDDQLDMAEALANA